jgi:threonyl-tRNA synthetase
MQKNPFMIVGEEEEKNNFILSVTGRKRKTSALIEEFAEIVDAEIKTLKTFTV